MSDHSGCEVLAQESSAEPLGHRSSLRGGGHAEGRRDASGLLGGEVRKGSDGCGLSRLNACAGVGVELGEQPGVQVPGEPLGTPSFASQ